MHPFVDVFFLLEKGWISNLLSSLSWPVWFRSSSVGEVFFGSRIKSWKLPRKSFLENGNLQPWWWFQLKKNNNKSPGFCGEMIQFDEHIFQMGGNKTHLLLETAMVDVSLIATSLMIGGVHHHGSHFAHIPCLAVDQGGGRCGWHGFWDRNEPTGGACEPKNELSETLIKTPCEKWWHHFWIEKTAPMEFGHPMDCWKKKQSLFSQSIPKFTSKICFVKSTSSKKHMLGVGFFFFGLTQKNSGTPSFCAIIPLRGKGIGTWGTRSERSWRHRNFPIRWESCCISWILLGGRRSGCLGCDIGELRSYRWSISLLIGELKSPRIFQITG